MPIKIGKPPKYDSAELMQSRIDSYFSHCEGERLTNAAGDAVLDKYDRPVVFGSHPPTVTGLALWLGFTGRQALLDYQGRAEFADTVTRAKSRIEQYTEERLFDRDGVQGARFSLSNNFSGWSETQDIRVSDGAVKIINNIPRGGGDSG